MFGVLGTAETGDFRFAANAVLPGVLLTRRTTEGRQEDHGERREAGERQKVVKAFFAMETQRTPMTATDSTKMFLAVSYRTSGPYQFLLLPVLWSRRRCDCAGGKDRNMRKAWLGA
jgi:hypothetical protein